MFSLIISIIAIALVAALAGASVYYGGSAFNKGTAGADASTAINAGQQINGAIALAENDGVTIADGNTTSATGLDTYLSQMPSYKGTPMSVDTTNSVVSVAVSDDVCAEVVNNRGGDDNVVTAANGLYGCDLADGTAGSHVFWYAI